MKPERPQQLAACLLLVLAGLGWGPGASESGGALAAPVLPISFMPLSVGDTTMFPLYANTSLYGVFITGLEFGTPPQPLQLLIDTGSGITHIASTGCGSSCGIGLAESRGYNFSASSTAAEVPCGEMCSCAYCSCDTLVRQEPACAYQLAYVDGSSSSGGVVSDKVLMGENAANLTFGVQKHQTGVLQGMGVDGLLGLDRTHSSFVGQLRRLYNESGSSRPVAFSTCWEVEHLGKEQGFPNDTASSFLLLGLPDSIMQTLQPQWTPLLPDSHAEWAVGLAGVEVEGPGGGTVTSELYMGYSFSGNSSSSSGNSSSGSTPQYGPAVMDSGATYSKLPKAAWARLQQLITSSAAARGHVKQVTNREAATCWAGLDADTLTGNAAALAEAFPTVTLRFQGGAAFSAGPSGYLVEPKSGQEIVCLSFFPWDRPLALIGSRVRQRVVTLHDDTGERMGFAEVEDCGELADDWQSAQTA